MISGSKFLKFLDKISYIAVIIAGFSILSAVLLISIETVLRKLFSISLGGVDEITSYILAISCSFSMSYTFINNSHIRIEIFYQYLKKYQYFLDLIALLGLSIFIFTLTYFGYKIVYFSIIKNSLANTPLQTPLAVPQFIWLVGFIFFSLVILSYFIAMLLVKPKKLLKQLINQ